VAIIQSRLFHPTYPQILRQLVGELCSAFWVNS
jgi:hypothetical protein